MLTSLSSVFPTRTRITFKEMIVNIKNYLTKTGCTMLSPMLWYSKNQLHFLNKFNNLTLGLAICFLLGHRMLIETDFYIFIQTQEKNGKKHDFLSFQ